MRRAGTRRGVCVAGVMPLATEVAPITLLAMVAAAPLVVRVVYVGMRAAVAAWARMPAGAAASLARPLAAGTIASHLLPPSAAARSIDARSGV